MPADICNSLPVPPQGFHRAAFCKEKLSTPLSLRSSGHAQTILVTLVDLGDFRQLKADVVRSRGILTPMPTFLGKEGPVTQLYLIKAV